MRISLYKNVSKEDLKNKYYDKQQYIESYAVLLTKKFNPKKMFCKLEKNNTIIVCGLELEDEKLPDIKYWMARMNRGLTSVGEPTWKMGDMPSHMFNFDKLDKSVILSIKTRL